MQVIVDKLDSPPPHALDLQDVKALVRAAKAEWGVQVRIVHLKATLPENSRFGRPVIYGYLEGPRLSICCRGLDKDEARREVLRELAIEGLRKSTRMVHRLSKAETEEIDRIIEPLLEAVKLDASCD